MELARTLGWVKVYVNFAYLWATTSLKFESRTKSLIVPKSRAHSIRHAITMGLTCAKIISILFFLVRDVRNGKFSLDDKFDIVYIGITTVSLYCFGSHLTIVWKAPAIASMFNSFILFYKDFARKYAKSLN
jgi:hypothetical protein